jgi:tetratricopeptide (TPR) repeat protein
MRTIRSYAALLSAVLLLCGFDWGFSGDTCKEAQKLADSLDSARDDASLRQAEARILAICPDGAPGHYVSALTLERIGNVEGAIKEYRQALQLNPQFAKASGNLGLLYAQTGRNNEATVELSRGLAASSNPRYHKALGRILAEMKVYPLAIHHLEEAGNTLTNDPEVFTDLAGIHLAMGQQEKALEEYGRALAADPGNEKAHTGIASIYLERNEPDKALELLKKGEISNPQNRQIHLMMAGIYEKKGESRLANYQYLLGGKGKGLTTPEYSTTLVASSATAPPAVASLSAPELEKAEESLKSVIRDSPDKAADAYGKLGDLYRSVGRDADAMAAYKEAVHRNCSNSDVYLNLGILHEKQNNLDEAVVAYKQAIRVKPDNADARLRLAEIRNSRGFNQEAVEQYSEFLKLRPNSPDIQLKLARILARNRETNLAIEAYGAVLKSAPDNPEANREIAALYRARGMNDKAVEHYLKALALQKEDSESRSALVAIYVKNKQYDEITDLLKGAVELFPEDASNHYKLGLIYEFKKDYESAIASYRKAAELKPDHARALNALGRMYMKTDRMGEAREALEAARKADPSLEETTVLLNNMHDEFNPEPRRISRSSRSHRERTAASTSRRSRSVDSDDAGSSKKKSGKAAARAKTKGGKKAKASATKAKSSSKSKGATKTKAKGKSKKKE